MRRKLVLGVGLAALVGGTAVGQFAVDRQPPGVTPPTLPLEAPKTTPVPPVSPSPQPAATGVLQPASPVMPVSPVTPTPPTPPLSPSTPGYTPLYSSPSLTPPTPPVSPSAPSYTPLYSSPTPAGGYVPPVDGLRPVTPTPPTPVANLRPSPTFTAQAVEAEIPTAIPKDHPWLLKPEHGPWFILVKSYSRPAKGSQVEESDRGLSAPEMAEALASDIRTTYRVQAFLFEYISEERKAEMRAILAARQKAANEYIAQLESLKQKSQLQGMDFLTPDNKFRVMRHSQRDQIGVLVGGFQTEADARKALVILKKWAPPKNELLMDGGAIVKPGQDGKGVSESGRLNPYVTAFVVPNPASIRTDRSTRPQELDPFLVKLNEGNPYNLLKAQKNWTLAVKSFSAPVQILNKNSETSVMQKMSLSKGRDVLAAAGDQAEAMAKAIRALKGPGGQPLNLEAFVLHTRTASLVTVGQFDSPDDPALLATRRLLASFRINVTAESGQHSTNGSLFDNPNLLPVPIPKMGAH